MVIGTGPKASVLGFQVGQFFPSQLIAMPLVVLLKECELCVWIVSDTTLLKDIYIFASHTLNVQTIFIFIFQICMVNIGWTPYRNTAQLCGSMSVDGKRRELKVWPYGWKKRT